MKNNTLAIMLPLAFASLQANAATIRFSNAAAANDNWTTPGNWVGGAVPVPADDVSFNFAGQVGRVTTNVGSINTVSIGVDENGGLIIASGGTLTTTSMRVGNNNAAVTNANLTVQNGGTLVVNGLFQSSLASSTGNISIESGGLVSTNNHLWFGVTMPSSISIAGTLSQSFGILGLGTINASTAGGGTATVNILNGGIFSLNNISGTSQNSIQAGSLINISGTGQLTLPGDFTGIINGYIGANKITGNGMAGSMNLSNVFNGTNTIVTAVPEPSSTLLIGFAGLALLSRRRRG